MGSFFRHDDMKKTGFNRSFLLNQIAKTISSPQWYKIPAQPYLSTGLRISIDRPVRVFR
jgi:hypothetical protein